MNVVFSPLFQYDISVIEFEPAVIDAVTAHMNGDHPEDNLLIAQAFGAAEATDSRMIGLTDVAGRWLVTTAAGEHELDVAWPGGPIATRPDIRREVVALYKAACEKLGVEPREEHAPEAPAHSHGGGHPHGAGHAHAGGHPHAGGHGGGHPHGAGTVNEGEEPGTFAKDIREATWGDHSDSEGATIMGDIMKGEATREEYASLVAQHFFMYEALEAAVAQFAGNPLYEPFHPQALNRMPALIEDLEHLYGPDWRTQIVAVPATTEYAARISEIAAEGWLPGIVAHHYTRFLGDLSGGQMIARIVAKNYGFERAGIAFYDFTELGPIPTFKRDYRLALNAMGASLTEEERARVIAEVRTAYKFNTATFVDMDKARFATV